MISISKGITALVLGLLIVTSTPTAAAYTSSNSASQLAYLQAELQRLQAILVQLQSGYYNNNNVTTGDVRVLRDGMVELRATAPGRSGNSVWGWFEYGPAQTMAYSTPMERITAGRSFTATADDVDANRTYYYRAVTETSSGDLTEGTTRTFRVSGDWDNDDWDDDDDWNDDDDDWRDNEDVPMVETDDADDVTENSAEIGGEVDMQDADNGLVFFAYGEDEESVEDVADESEYRDLDEDGDDLQLIQVDSSFDGDDDFIARLTGLDDDTEYYFRICVEYEDEDDDEQIECGEVESFETDN